MPQLYENPARFLQDLSKKVLEGWAVIEFDYHKEKLVLKDDAGNLLKAVHSVGRVEWLSLTPREVEALKGTDRFYII